MSFWPYHEADGGMQTFLVSFNEADKLNSEGILKHEASLVGQENGIKKKYCLDCCTTSLYTNFQTGFIY